MRSSLLAALIVLLASAPLLATDRCQLDIPTIVLASVPFSIAIEAENEAIADDWSLRVDSATFEIPAAADGVVAVHGISAPASGSIMAGIYVDDRLLCSAPIRVLSPWLSLLPPFIAIAMAFALRSVLPALLLGLWAGAWLLEGAGLRGLFLGLLSTFEQHIPAALLDPEHVAVILFTMMIGGMIGILSSNGGMLAIVEAIQDVVRTRRAGQLMTAGLGFTIFFDDYANTLLVGKTMRPLTDRLKVSRQKLAYIVDSTASPVACLALVTTWIGYEVSIIAANQPAAIDYSAYTVFLASLPYSFYPILTLLFVMTIAATGRDFGPMHRAETAAISAPPADEAKAAARSLDEDEVPETPIEAPRRIVNFIAPIIVLVVSLMAGLFVTGEGSSLQQIVGSADPYKALMWASFLGVLTAGLLTVVQRILTLEQTLDSWYAGMRNTLFAMIILVMAWALSAVTQELHAADFLIARFGSDLAPQLLPALTFILAALISFATGSCYGTMGIVMPIVLPLTWGVLGEHGLANAHELHPIYLSVIASVLAGSIWGDHSSPISDTTILSAMSAGCDHLEHVRTQLPYALTVGIISLVCGILPVAYGLPWWTAIAVSVTVTIGLPFLLGRPSSLGKAS